jgi:hypothetical protein
MSLHSLTEEIISIIINYLLIKEASNYSIIDKENNRLIKQYYNSNMNKICCSLEKWNKTFPNAIYLNIRCRYNISGLDFKYLSNIKRLDMSLCTQTSITDYSFEYLTSLVDLNLQGACGHWRGGNHFTDKLFDFLTNLKKLYIDDNHVITNNGIKKLINIKDLTIRNCANISNEGLTNLTTLQKLNIYNLHRLTDNVFKNLTNIKELDMTFGNISDIGISHLINIEKLHFLSCDNIKFNNFDKLTKLHYLSICGGSNILDDDIKSLSNIKTICLYGCKINGLGIKYLINCTSLSIYESPIIDEHLDNLYKLYSLKKINIFRCNIISKNKKAELKSIYDNNYS